MEAKKQNSYRYNTSCSHVLGQRSRESLPNKLNSNSTTMMMMMVDHRNNHHRQFQSIETGDLDGPTSNTTTPPRTNDIYDVFAPDVYGGGAAVTTLQPFHTCSSSSSTTTTTAAAVSYTALKSPGGTTMAASVGFPFTNAQLKELERQAMIYKYMMASVPVPLDLLLPFTRNLSASALSHSPLGSEFKLRFPNGTDAEPGRCKRTDGKKWRCSRDVAPDQKYCERHMHRGRPRSRKHVEVQLNNNNNKRTRHDNNNHHALSVASSTLEPTSNFSPQMTQNHFLGSSSALPYHPAPVFESVPSLYEDKEGRSLEWMMKGEAVPMTASDPRWLHLMQTKIEIPSKPSFCDTNHTSIFSQHAGEEPFLNLNSYANFSTGEDEQDRECALFLNPEAVSLENQTNSETPRSFIDAWSKVAMEESMAHSNRVNQSSVSSLGKLSPSSLTLSMGGSGSMNDELGRAQVGSGLNGSDTKSHVTSWLTPASWVASQPGGPLAEVLRPSSVTATTTSAASDPSSPFAGNRYSGSPPATAVSSPSGVLQKTVASLSDSSGCSSPAIGSSKVKAEIALL